MLGKKVGEIKGKDILDIYISNARYHGIMNTAIRSNHTVGGRYWDRFNLDGEEIRKLLEGFTFIVVQKISRRYLYIKELMDDDRLQELENTADEV